MNPAAKSPNFAFLEVHAPLLITLAASAENLCFREPVLCLVRLRQLAEAMAMEALSITGQTVGLTGEGFDLLTALRTLEQRNAMGAETAQVFHVLRRAGNQAVHQNAGSRGEALQALRLALRAATWFHRTLKDPGFKVPAFVPPPTPVDVTAALAAELEELRSKLVLAESTARSATLTAAQEAELRQRAEVKAVIAYADLEAALTLADESEAKWRATQTQFATTLSAAPPASAAAVGQTLQFAANASAALGQELDEADTRVLIDEQLRAAGWEADSAASRYALGARPERGKPKAIAEWPTASGPVDYALFAGLTAVGVIEAKKQSTDVPGVLAQQAKRYARDIHFHGHATPPAGGPWGDFRVPFLFATNGRPYLRQLETRSGVWFLDGRTPTNLPRALDGWYSPTGLLESLRSEPAKADLALSQTPVDLPGLRPYQRLAIEAVETAVAAGRRDLLLAMATGTGKTRTCLSLLYRVVRAGRFRRVLFLVDRTELGNQASDAFRDVKLEGLQSFGEIYEVKQLGDVRPEADTRVHLATVQSMVKRLLLPAEDEPPFPVDQYDCVVVDECHRGYVLDRELGEREIGFTDEADYISKYRRVLDHFDAVRIGLTATPALHTREIFGAPVFTYSYRQAVIDGYLIDHEPPHRILTHLNQDGIHWRVGEEVKRLDPLTGTVDLSLTPDEIDMDVETFNSQVLTRPFNETVCTELARHLDPHLPGKTLIFCVNDAHADLVVHLLQGAFAARYPDVYADTVAKITGASDHPSLLVRRYKNEELPKVGVTVDLLTTGIDVPTITNLVFLRRVKSRILYEQMLGRATRLCPDLFGPGQDKEVFHIYDAVDLYTALQDFTEMRPVVTDPALGIRQIVDALAAAKDDPAAQAHFHAQLLAKLNRRRSVLRAHEDKLRHRVGTDAKTFLANLRAGSPADASTLFTQHPGLADFLDSLRPGGRRPGVLLSEHLDTIIGVESGYGEARKPEDYLESFGAWVRDHINEVPALLVVTQRPRELTRAALRGLRLALEEAGYTETYLQTAWREARNEDVAAGIVGFIRAQALGSPLVPYAERVDRAVGRVLGTRRYHWTAPQQQWLKRIAAQIKKDDVLDRDAVNTVPVFAAKGGFAQLDPVFDGRLAELLGDVQEEIWRDAA